MALITILSKEIGHIEGWDHWYSGPDSAGGVSVKLSFRNNTDKTIKYINFGVAPYNSVGDFVESDIPGQNGILQYTGPLASGQAAYGRIWDNVFYNYSIKGIKIVGATIEFTDGSKQVITEFNYSESSTGGCYIATCVYGSYDCPQVWTLRRYRDYTLDKTLIGRMFIKFYYKISPTIVKKFGKKKWFRNFWKKKLDKKVKKLNDNGVEDTQYFDKY